MPTRLKEDIATIIKNDPATKSFFDAFFNKSGIACALVASCGELFLSSQNGFVWKSIIAERSFLD